MASGLGQISPARQSWLLAIGAGGTVAALLALAGLRALPGGSLLFWLAACPIFMAGLGFGPLAGALAAAVAALVVLMGSTPASCGLFLAIVGLPAAIMLAVARDPGGGVDASRPLAVLGLWPFALLLFAAWLSADFAPGGLDGVVAGMVAMGLATAGLVASPEMVAAIEQVTPAVMAFWVVLSLAGSAMLAYALLARRVLAPVPLAPARARPWSSARLPAGYLLLPAMAAGLWLSGAGPTLFGSTIVTGSALLILLLPVFLQGVGGVHARLAGRAGGRAMLVLFYILLVIANAPAAIVITALGLYEQWHRGRAPPRKA